MREWKPIETAPQDEDVFFLIYTGHNGTARCCDVVRLGWHENGKPVWFNEDVAVEGTHWLPLPEPPTK